MEGYFVLDDRGEPLEEKDFATWTRWFEQADRNVARTVVTSEVTVLTTFSGDSRRGCSKLACSAACSTARNRGTRQRATQSRRTRRWPNGAASAHRPIGA